LDIYQPLPGVQLVGAQREKPLAKKIEEEASLAALLLYFFAGRFSRAPQLTKRLEEARYS